MTSSKDGCGLFPRVAAWRDKIPTGGPANSTTPQNGWDEPNEVDR